MQQGCYAYEHLSDSQLFSIGDSVKLVQFVIYSNKVMLLATVNIMDSFILYFVIRTV